jgi:hypothetical protein
MVGHMARTVAGFFFGGFVRAMGPLAVDIRPFDPGRCIELSRAAASAIGMGGTARVSVE